MEQQMLEIRHLSRIYNSSSKNMPEVRALDDVSITFPEKGMVFLTGKSGSGKSTMLNVIGGLDAFNAGEIIIKGRSSNDFREKDFDSYRNTFIGFVFQEYNLLEDFTVEKNIALALDLQGKSVNAKVVNEILALVELEGYAKRKPNQLSGGQKQRVAIARALIKNPQIIMADEPTGALDTATGRQVLDILKSLSKTRLVIVVSHDREYADRYADRIVELKDGKIISDTTKRTSQMKYIANGINLSGASTIVIEAGKTMDAEEAVYISQMINANNKDGVVISMEKELNTSIRQVAHMDVAGNRYSFSETSKDDIKAASDKDFTLIKSRFKYSDSIKMGLAGLKVKPWRLALTILLVAIALTFFGIADTAGSFNAARSMFDSIQEEHSTTIGIAGQAYYSYGKTSDLLSLKLGDNDVKVLKDKFNSNSFVGGYAVEETPNLYTYNVGNSNYYVEPEVLYYPQSEEYSSMGLKIKHGSAPTTTAAGQIPQVAISEYLWDCYIDLNYNNMPLQLEIKEDSWEVLKGRRVTINGKDHAICGVYETGFDYKKYSILKEGRKSEITAKMKAMVPSFHDYLRYSFHNAFFLASQNKPAALNRIAYDNTTISTADAIYDTSATHIAQIDKLGSPEKFSEDNIIFFSKNTTKIGINEAVISVNALRNKDKSVFDCFISNEDRFTVSDNRGAAPIYYSPENVESLNNLLTELIQGTEHVLGIKSSEYSTEIDLNTSLSAGTQSKVKIVGIYTGLLSVNNPYYDYIDPLENTILLTGETIASNRILKSHFSPYTIVQAKLSGNARQDYKLVSYISGFGDAKAKYIAKNQFTSFFTEFVSTVYEVSRIYLAVGVVFALFSSLMMMNFITMTISYKKREIGILRAIGARSSDVLKIFFNESIFITAINFVLAVIFTFLGVLLVNYILVGQFGISVILLKMGFRQVAWLAFISVVVAVLSSFFPVRRISNLKPIDAIQNRK